MKKRYFIWLPIINTITTTNELYPWSCLSILNHLFNFLVRACAKCKGNYFSLNDTPTTQPTDIKAFVLNIEYHSCFELEQTKTNMKVKWEWSTVAWNHLNANFISILFNCQVLILLAIAAVVAADSYGKSSYGGYKTDYTVSFVRMKSNFTTCRLYF